MFDIMSLLLSVTSSLFLSSSVSIPETLELCFSFFASYHVSSSLCTSLCKQNAKVCKCVWMNFPNLITSKITPQSTTNYKISRLGSSKMCFRAQCFSQFSVVRHGAYPRRKCLMHEPCKSIQMYVIPYSKLLNYCTPGKWSFLFFTQIFPRPSFRTTWKDDQFIYDSFFEMQQVVHCRCLNNHMLRYH